jgi:hypothetical protein
MAFSICLLNYTRLGTQPESLQAEGFSPALPPFSGRGSTSLPAMAFVITKAPLGRVPAGRSPGGGSGPMPPASELWQGGVPPANTWRPRCRYWAKLERISFPEQSEELAGRVGTAWEKHRLEGDAPSGPTRDHHVWIRPNNGFTSGSLFCLDAGGLGGEGFSVGSNGLALHRRRAERRRSARSRQGLSCPGSSAVRPLRAASAASRR